MVLVGQFSGRQRSNKEAARGMADLGPGQCGVWGAEPSSPQADPVCLRTVVSSLPLLGRLSLVLELG